MSALIPLVISAAVLAPSRSGAEASEDVTSFRQEAAGIDFYVERRGSGPEIVLVPSGQGDSQTYDFLAAELASDFTLGGAGVLLQQAQELVVGVFVGCHFCF